MVSFLTFPDLVAFEVSEKRWAILIGTDGKIEKTLGLKRSQDGRIEAT